MANFNCRLDIPEVSGLKTAEVTVGREFQVTCTGPWPAITPASKLSFELKPEQKYSLHLLGAEPLSGDTVRLNTTSYQVGAWNFQPLVLDVDGNKLELAEINFETVSVLDPLEPQQEPYGLLGPVGLGWPLLWWVVLLVLVGGFILSGGQRWYRRVQRKKLLDSLREHDSALSPIAEFYQTLRRLRRESEVFGSQSVSTELAKQTSAELENAFRLFFLREFRLPALTWPDRELLRAFRKENRSVDSADLAKLRKLFREMSAAQKAEKLSARDVVQIAEQSRQLAERFEALSRRSS